MTLCLTQVRNKNLKDKFSTWIYPRAAEDIAEWLGYDDKGDFYDCCRKKPQAVKDRIRRRAKGLGVPMPKLSH